MHIERLWCCQKMSGVIGPELNEEDETLHRIGAGENEEM
jgi:hypothetical protein